MPVIVGNIEFALIRKENAIPLVPVPLMMLICDLYPFPPASPGEYGSNCKSSGLQYMFMKSAPRRSVRESNLGGIMEIQNKASRC
jgi:hypothetical protein